METKEFEFKGFVMNGFIALFVEIILVGLCIVGFTLGDAYPILPLFSVIGLVLAVFLPIGFRKLEPNEAMVMLFFGKYRGTFTKTGYTPAT